MNDLAPESISQARGRGDSTLIFKCRNGRENGPYDHDAFAIRRAGRKVRPVSLRVDGQSIIATFADPLEYGDTIAAN